MDHQFQWVEFYEELARKLVSYRNNRGELLEKVREIYRITGINMPTLEQDNRLVDVDPFTIFGLFNKSSMREANRIKLIGAVKKIFEISSEVPTAFNSIPVLNNQNATFYYWVNDRGENDIENLWRLFEAGLSYADRQTSEHYRELSEFFDIVINTKGNGNSKVTICFALTDISGCTYASGVADAVCCGCFYNSVTLIDKPTRLIFFENQIRNTQFGKQIRFNSLYSYCRQNGL